MGGGAVPPLVNLRVPVEECETGAVIMIYGRPVNPLWIVAAHGEAAVIETLRILVQEGNDLGRSRRPNLAAFAVGVVRVPAAVGVRVVQPGPVRRPVRRSNVARAAVEPATARVDTVQENSAAAAAGLGGMTASNTVFAIRLTG